MPRDRAGAQDRLLRWIVAAAYILSVAMPLQRLDAAGLVTCPFRLVTGLPCPGCGMTHAFVALSHGHLVQALRYNALSLPLYLGGLAWLAAPHIPPSVLVRLPSPPLRVRTSLWWAALAASLLYGALRIGVPSLRPF